MEAQTPSPQRGSSLLNSDKPLAFEFSDVEIVQDKNSPSIGCHSVDEKAVTYFSRIALD